MLPIRRLPILLALAAVMALAAAASAAAQAPVADWNKSYTKQHFCAQTHDPNPAAFLAEHVTMRWAFFDMVGSYTVPRRPNYKSTVPDEDETGTGAKTCTSGAYPGLIRLDITERLTVTNHPSNTNPQVYFHKGGQGYDPSTIPYGHVWRNELRNPPEPLYPKSELDARGANPRTGSPTPYGAGRACGTSGTPGITGSFWITGSNAPPSTWTYKPNAPHADYDKYVKGGLEQGPMNVNYSYLTWSWVAQRQWDTDAFIGVSGGGAVRTILPVGSVFDRCNIWAINGRAYEGANYVGRVTAIYGRVWVGYTYLYGWVVHSWGRRSDNYATRICVLARVGAEHTC